MYEKLLPVTPGLLDALMVLLDYPVEEPNPLQCWVTFDGVHYTISILDEPAGARMYINGEWLLTDKVAEPFNVYLSTEPLDSADLLTVVEDILRNQVRSMWDVWLADFAKLSQIVGPYVCDE